MIRQFKFESYADVFTYATDYTGTYIDDTRVPVVLANLDVDLFDPDASGVAVSSVEGLGPVDATIHTAEAAAMDGAYYNGSRKQTRTINFNFVYYPTEDLTIEDIRKKLYKVFRVKSKMKITIVTDSRTVYTYGYVEKHEPDIFSKQTAVNISILCPDPYFYGNEYYEELMSTTYSMFEFPFSTEVIADHSSAGIWDEIDDDIMENQIIFGEVTDTKTAKVYNTGDCDTGITIEIHYSDMISYPEITNITTGEKFKLNCSLMPASGTENIIYINTRQGNKSVYLLNTRRLDFIYPYNDWIHLQIGENLFAYTLNGNEPQSDDDGCNIFISYRNRYDGV